VCSVIGIVIFTGLSVFLSLWIYYTPYDYCHESSLDVFDGEENLCRVPSWRDVVYVNVRPRMRRNFTSYMFETEPTVLDQVRYVEYSDSNVFVKPKHYTYYAFALPNGSHISYSVSSNHRVTWYWSREYSSIESLRKNCINYDFDKSSYSFTARESMTYYLTCYNGGSYDTANTTWRINVTYTTYDLSNAQENCTGKMRCTFKNSGNKFIVSKLDKGSLKDGQYTKNVINFGRQFSDALFIVPTVFICIGMLIFGIATIVCLVKCHKLTPTTSSVALTEKSDSSTEQQQLLTSTPTTADFPTESPSETPTTGPSSSDTSEAPPVYITPTEE